MDVVRQIKKLSGQRKGVGHGGTLDPQAEGVLVMCFGQATRLMEFLVDSLKEYRMEVCLGITTSTYDGEGEVTKRGDASDVSIDTIEGVLDSFRGSIDQTPPMYSALKVEGKRLYQLARAGVEVERPPRKVEIYQLQILEYNPPTVVLNVHSGRGAYMRSLAHDIGEALGCGGYLKNLVRLKSGPFRVEEARALSDVHSDASDGSWNESIAPVDSVLLSLKSLVVGKPAERYIRSGQAVNLPASVGANVGYLERFRAYTNEGCLLAVVSYDKPNSQWRPYKVFHLDTPSPHAPNADPS